MGMWFSRKVQAAEVGKNSLKAIKQVEKSVEGRVTLADNLLQQMTQAHVHCSPEDAWLCVSLHICLPHLSFCRHFVSYFTPAVPCPGVPKYFFLLTFLLGPNPHRKGQQLCHSSLAITVSECEGLFKGNDQGWGLSVQLRAGLFQGGTPLSFFLWAP